MNDTNNDNITFDDILLERDETPASAPAARPIQRADEILARLALEDALDGPARRRIKRGGTLAMVVRVPTPAWVGPMHAAAAALGAWDEIFVRTGTDRRHTADQGNDDVMHRLVRGGRILGIAPHPDRHLPSALVAAADVLVTVRPPSAAMVRRAIKAVTGSVPRQIPAAIGAGLDAHDICGAIRIGTTPTSCVRRLQAASRRHSRVDPAVAGAPLLNELHGFGAAMTWAENLVHDLQLWRRGELPFEAIDRRCVWSGPPGCGKTTLARSLARTAGLPLVATSVSSWFTQSAGYLDSVLKEWQRTVSTAASLSPQPALLFLDELDALPDRRTVSDRARDYWTTLVTQILLDLDSASSDATAQLIVIGATNHPERLDAALTRPGRLNRVVSIGMPDAQSLAGILRYHLGPNDLADADLGPLARLAVGATGAEVAQWVRGARRRARMEGRGLDLSDLRSEILPPDRRSHGDLRRCAVHEAGHAALTRLTGVGTVAEISVVDRDGGGHMSATTGVDTTLTRADVEMIVIAILGGRAAEEVVFGAATSGSGGSPRSDLALATQLLASTHASMGLGNGLVYRAAPEAATSLLSLDPDLRRTVEADIDRLYACALGLVREHRRLVESLADLLVADKVVLGTDFERLFSAYARAVTTRSPRRGGRHG